MQHIQTVTVGSGGSASITFSAIPATFTDLVLVGSLRSTRASFFDGGQIQFNGDTATTFYRARFLFGDGVSPGTFGDTNALSGVFHSSAASATANTFANSSVYIPNYLAAAAKSVSGDGTTENNATNAIQSISAGLWNNTDAITSILIKAQNGNLVQHSSISLYGILKGSDGITAVS